MVMPSSASCRIWLLYTSPVLSVLNTNTRAIALYTRMGWKLTSGTELEFTPEQYPAVVKKCAPVSYTHLGPAKSR